MSTHIQHTFNTFLSSLWFVHNADVKLESWYFSIWTITPDLYKWNKEWQLIWNVTSQQLNKYQQAHTTVSNQTKGCTVICLRFNGPLRLSLILLGVFHYNIQNRHKHAFPPSCTDTLPVKGFKTAQYLQLFIVIQVVQDQWIAEMGQR